MRLSPYITSRIAAIFAALVLCALQVPTAAQVSEAPEPPKLSSPDFDSLQQGVVIRVLDEDTVLLRIGGKNERYDLLGITSFSTREKSNQAASMIALGRMMLNERVLVQHDPNGTRNRANRLCAYFYRSPDHLPVNLELIRQGYARYSSSWMSVHTEVFEYYDQRARELERGIWGAQAPSAAEEDEILQPVESEPKHQNDNASQTSREMVFVTKYGKKYHREGCSHLTPTARPISVEDIEESHEPCKSCKPDEP